MFEIRFIDIFLFISFYWYNRVSLVSHVVSSSDAVPCAFHMISFYLNQMNQSTPERQSCDPLMTLKLWLMTLMRKCLVCRTVRWSSPPLVRPV